jgi:peptidoglycan hydrolase-like protein with peptidoglycan-binding domain
VPPSHPPDGTPNIPAFPGAPLLIGSRSNDVRTLQTLLNGIARCNPSMETLVVDGVFGPRTQGAVREFQRLFGLPQDGIADMDTWYRAVDEFNLLQGAPCTQIPPPPPPPTPNPPFPGTSLRVGSRGEDVRIMQRFLNNIARVFPIIPGNLAEDGIFGPLTEASVRAFQTFFGLNSDGVIGPLTWARIVDINSSLPNIVAPQFPGNLQVGSTGNNVRIVQQYLNDLGPAHPSIPRLNVDGIFGPITQSAVMAFQRIFGFTANGIVNQLTWNFLVSLRNLQTQMSRTTLSMIPADTEDDEAISVFYQPEQAEQDATVVRPQPNNRNLLFLLIIFLLMREMRTAR